MASVVMPMMMVRMDRSDSIVPKLTERCRVLGPFPGYVQLTYAMLRVGPEGDILANFDAYSDAWVLKSDGSWWSDIVVYAEP